MLTRLKEFENRSPQIVFHWQDELTEAEGWVVINSLRNGAAGGGTRMRKGCTMQEVLSLAKTMEVKFAVCGPPIGGAKSGINFDPEDPRKHDVLNRWYQAVMPLLKTYYGTGGDLNVDEVAEVMPITEQYGLLHPQEGVVNGHLHASPEDRDLILQQLMDGVKKHVTHFDYAPTTDEKDITVSDMVTGYGVAMAVVHADRLWDRAAAGKRVIIQGFGNVGGAAALTLAKEGYKVVGIIDRRGGLMEPEGLDLESIKRLYLNRDGNQLVADHILPFEQVNEQIWSMGAEVFIPAAGSRLVTKAQTDAMIAHGLETISCGANVPFADPDIFLGETALHADAQISVIPDFIANCGMARTFAYFMQPGVSMEDEDIFQDISQTILDALAKTHGLAPDGKNLWSKSLEWVLKDLLPETDTASTLQA
ncbi:Glu/Leu/Phe/Val dehydrogenase dimerization domain-containing protein [Pontibacter sp. G13]|uniref:Glu/Leu/Phe/Val dehydrogenase dimerization domain-containing protein n=1 Tax=Pontibacter sp. G13 TaxID=3074898 RepID=UPI00288903A0|nr:Glu/Leu/Phe/Val dehydrogenase dimerization domain-containing protein [Pontibacter sp. G13]WNJ20242.1 Glu/Leu/Phe/Val dehydrogenase dimerization domain-containing protein [Pontibacter sp. G13]